MGFRALQTARSHCSRSRSSAKDITRFWRGPDSYFTHSYYLVLRASEARAQFLIKARVAAHSTVTCKRVAIGVGGSVPFPFGAARVLVNRPCCWCVSHWL